VQDGQCTVHSKVQIGKVTPYLVSCDILSHENPVLVFNCTKHKEANLSHGLPKRPLDTRSWAAHATI